jgi:hypothetical protein
MIPQPPACPCTCTYTYQQSIFTSLGDASKTGVQMYPRLLDIRAIKMTKVPLYIMLTRYGAIMPVSRGYFCLLQAEDEENGISTTGL